MDRILSVAEMNIMHAACCGGRRTAAACCMWITGGMRKGAHTASRATISPIRACP